MQPGPATDYEQQWSKPAPDFLHSVAQSRVLFALHSAGHHRYRVVPELDLELADGTVATPDISVLPWREINWGHEPELCSEVPALVVEVLLRGQTDLDVMLRAARYFAHGIPSVWVVNPSALSIAIHQPGEKEVRVIQRGEANDPATSLSVCGESIFS